MTKANRPTYAALELPDEETADVVIYVIPNGGDAERYTVLAPFKDRRSLVERLETGDLTIYAYQQCSHLPKEAIQEQLMKEVQALWCKAKLRGMRAGMSTGLLGALTLSSWAFPDPLWLTDELLLPLGAGAGYLGWRVLERKTSTYSTITGLLPRKIEGVSIAEHPLLTALFDKMRLWEANQVEEAMISHEWIEDVLQQADMDLEHGVALAEALDDYLGLARLLKRSRSSLPLAKRRHDKLRARITRTKGVSESALDMYAMFYEAMIEEPEEG